MVPSSWLVRTAAFQRVGWFEESLRNGEDTDWMARARDAGLRIQTLPEELLGKRIHDANLSRRAHAPEILRLLRASVVRKHASGSAP